MAKFELVVEPVQLPALVIHGGAGAYLKTTSAQQRFARGQTLSRIVSAAYPAFAQAGAKAATLSAISALEADPSFNAGYGSRLQRDGQIRVSAALMDGKRQRSAAVYNAQGCLHPSQLTDALLERGDRNLDGDGAALLMEELGIATQDLRTERSIERWKKLVEGGDGVDREGAIGDAGEDALEAARRARAPVPKDLETPDPENRYGTVGAVAAAPNGELWACTSTGGRGHEAVGRISDSPTPTGNYACPLVAISATGFGEQILDLNLCGRIATRMLDGSDLKSALSRTFDEVVQFGGLLGVIAISADGHAGYAYSTEACGVAWYDANQQVHVDRHGRAS